MTTKEIGISLHEELDRREALIKQLTEEANAIRVVLGVLERPTPEQHNRVTKVVGRRGRKKKATTPPPTTRRATDQQDDQLRFQTKLHVSTGGHCKKHTNATFDKGGRCKICQAEYMKQYWLKKKGKTEKPNGAAQPSNPSASQERRPLVRCDQCGDGFPDAKAMGLHKTRVHFGVNP